LIDECEEHGVWLNHGELRALVDWKKELKASQDREAEEENYRKYGLQKKKSPYPAQNHSSTKLDDFLHWLFGG
jgi:Zn-finger nucleic acid-binding protein